jgi:hypothetical protein
VSVSGGYPFNTVYLPLNYSSNPGVTMAYLTGVRTGNARGRRRPRRSSASPTTVWPALPTTSATCPRRTATAAASATLCASPSWPTATWPRFWAHCAAFPSLAPWATPSAGCKSRTARSLRVTRCALHVRYTPDNDESRIYGVRYREGRPCAAQRPPFSARPLLSLVLRPAVQEGERRHG